MSIVCPVVHDICGKDINNIKTCRHVFYVSQNKDDISLEVDKYIQSSKVNKLAFDREADFM